ncbi:MAG: hypothetical protein ACHP79_07520, partial [Terriglobales bacterium]
MAGTAGALATSADNRNSGSLTWAVSLFASGYFAWLGISLFRVTPIFLDLYASLSADLPLQTRLLISFRWLYPLLFVGAIAVVIAKQFYVRDKWRNLAITFGFVAIIEALSNAIVGALYAPI